MTVFGYNQVIPLSIKRSGRFMILLFFGLSLALPNALKADAGRFDFGPIRLAHDVNRPHLDVITALDLLLLSSSEPQKSIATLDIICPANVVAKCNSPEAAIPTNVFEFQALGGSISSTCGLISVKLKVIETSLGGCPEVLTRSVFAVDGCGGEASCTYNVTILDDQEPPMLHCPEDITVECADDIPDADATTVTVTDMCGTVKVKHLSDDTTSLGLCPGVVYRRYIAEDQCGDVATCIQTITVNNKCDPDDPCNSICDSDVPLFTVNLSGNADSTWISPETLSEGSCCSQQADSSDMCVHFSLTLADDAVAIQLEILSGPNSPGAMSFQIGCTETFSVNEIICMTGGQSLELTFCQPGSELYVFAITSYNIASLPDEDQDGVPDQCVVPCKEMKLDLDDCLVVYPGYAQAECADITVTPFGGIAPFSYLWSTNDTTQSITVCPLSHQLYSVTVTDSLGCSIMGSILVFVVNVSCNVRDVQICHLDPLTGQFSTQCVADSVVANHLGHGDYLGACGSIPCYSFDYPVHVKNIGLSNPDISGLDIPFPGVIHTEGIRDYIFPNPVNDEMTIQYVVSSSETVVFEILDTQGRRIDTGTSLTEAGSNAYHFNTSSFESGLYFVRYAIGHEIRSLKFLKL